MDTGLAALLGSIFTLVGGIVGFALKWYFDNKQNTRKYREETIKHWREYAKNKPSKSYRDFVNTAEYRQMEPYLDESLKSDLSDIYDMIYSDYPGDQWDIDEGEQRAKIRILAEIARIEKDVWKLL
jgi:hypothetical protein